jgi:hypothetical protein
MFGLPFFNQNKRSQAPQPKFNTPSNQTQSLTNNTMALAVQSDLEATEDENAFYPESIQDSAALGNKGMDRHDLNWEQFTLVAKEDIYYNQDDMPVLLMKAGQGVDIHQVAKLIKFGVLP